MEIAVEDLNIDLPPMEVPEPVIETEAPEPLVSSDMESSRPRSTRSRPLTLGH